jgi:long-chain-fatty-acid--CoA ligase ACSBG
MLSHDNIYWMNLAACSYLGLRDATEIMVSYLPLSHIAANMVDIWSPIATRGTIYFADRNALKGSLLETLQEVR